ncbi:hypothetical protein POL68_22460 [Stigmatella sp. ncwal1]|uniref:Uncharacterized protein n=1 Tax=Stigmatella ashevillensis TaxID=2995309 RepID=A0ABT5DC50_9BACT|nr:hypothetical protein [Stigmatella ashevillena]MDC0711250.1 hypothetical protein [Stigmatella ashevillena]
MTTLCATPKPSDAYPRGPLSEISVGPGGTLQVKCADDVTYERVTSLLAERLFVQGRGFPKLKRGPDGRLTRDPSTKKFQIEDHVNLARPPREVLEAIRDNLEATEQFELSWKD